MLHLLKSTSALILTLLITQLSAQEPANVVQEAERRINAGIEEVHSLAGKKDVYQAMERLDVVNKELNKEITWGTFDEVYKKAKLAEPGFKARIRTDLPQQLTPDFWAEYEAKCEKHMKLQRETLEGMTAMLQMDRFEQLMAYGSQIKGIYDAFTGAIENLGTGNLPKFAYDLYGNMNDFVDGYKRIEAANLADLDRELFKMEIRGLMSKAQKSQELYNDYKHYINARKGIITDFQANVKYVNDLMANAESGPLMPLSYADLKYNWDYGPFQYDFEYISQHTDELYDDPCQDYKNDVNSLEVAANENWELIKANINASDDYTNKQEFLKFNLEQWQEFEQYTQNIYSKTIDIICGNSGTEGTFDVSNLEFRSGLNRWGQKKNIEGSHTIIHPAVRNFGVKRYVYFDEKLLNEHSPKTFTYTMNASGEPKMESTHKFILSIPQDASDGPHVFTLEFVAGNKKIRKVTNMVFKGSYIESYEIVEDSDVGTEAEVEESKDEDYGIYNLSIMRTMMDYGGGQRFVELEFDLKHKTNALSYRTNVELNGQRVTQNTRSKTTIGYSTTTPLNFAFPLPDHIKDGSHELKLIVNADDKVLEAYATIILKGAMVSYNTNVPVNSEEPEAAEIDWNATTTQQPMSTTTAVEPPVAAHQTDPKQVADLNETTAPSNSNSSPTSTLSEGTSPEAVTTPGIVYDGDQWSAQRVFPNKLQENVSSAVNNNNTPIGIYIAENGEITLLYIDENPLAMTAWSMEWYADGDELQAGITSNMNNGYFPMGISFTDDSELFVLYIESQINAPSWQIVESPLDLDVVAKDIQGYIDQEFLPVGITIFGGMYYTMLAQLPGSDSFGWTIRGYQGSEAEVFKDIDQSISQGLVPFGFLKEGDITNVLFVQF